MRAQCQSKGDTVSFDLAQEDEVICLLAQLQRNAHSWMLVHAVLANCLGFIARQNDVRITNVVQTLRLRANDPRNAQAWAQEVGLSSSRFQHLFKQCTGLSFRRFRLWARIRIALAQVMRGKSMTDAAMHAGLASSAHLSTAFKEMFGITPSKLVGVLPIYVES